jgi:hypothetical protein
VDELDRLPKGLIVDDVRMAVAEIGNLPEWPAETAYVDAELPAAFSKLIRPAFHGELEGARIAHLYKQQLGGHGGCRTVARAKKASAELAFLADVDFVILYSWRAWGGLTLWQRLAVVDHELSHCGRDPDTGWITIPHDLEEFGTVAHRWGAWQPGIAMFRRQLDLFAEVKA